MATANTPFDFGSVAVEAAEMPQTGAGRKRKYESNPFEDVMRASYADFTDNKNPGRQVTVPANAANEAVYLIRLAADDLKIGSRVILKNSKGDTITPKDITSGKVKGNVTVLFSAKNRRQAKSNGE